MKKILSLAVLIVFGLIFSLDAWGQNPAEQLHLKTDERLSKLIKQSPAVTGLAVVDLTTNEMVFGFNEDQVFPQASAIKIPILMEVFKQSHEGRYKLSDERTVDPENLVGGTGILKHLNPQNDYSIQDLSVLMIALSDNSATNQLIDLTTMAEINSTLEELGMTKTRLRRNMMAIEASAQGQENTSTPAEAVQILQTLFNGEFPDAETSSAIIEMLHKTPQGESRLGVGVPSDVPVAFKPGGLKGVSTEWAIVQLDERPYAVAAMEKYKVEGEAEKNMEKISKILFEYFWRLGNSTEYGVYRDPEMMNKKH